MSWHVDITDEAEPELKCLPADMYARFLHIAEMLEESGPHEVGMPHVAPLERKLWEMRMRGRDGIARAIYFAAHGQRLIVVRAFVKKTQKTPRKEIDIAYARMQGWHEHEKLQRLAQRSPGKPRH
jgi:phage-related protein